MGKPCISLSHQAAVINKNSPKSRNFDPVGKAILRSYAPCTSQYGFHFKIYDNNIFTPVIRTEIRVKKPSKLGHYTVYLPAYDDVRIIKILSMIDDVQWQVFSKHNKQSIQKGNVWIRPINNDEFIDSMSKATGVFCGAGFETPAEAMFLKKKLMVIPMKGQYEQQCNAAALEEMGVPVIKSLKKKHLKKIVDWVLNGEIIPVDYSDMTETILRNIIAIEAKARIDKMALMPKESDFQLSGNTNFLKKLAKIASGIF